MEILFKLSVLNKSVKINLWNIIYLVIIFIITFFYSILFLQESALLELLAVLQSFELNSDFINGKLSTKFILILL